MTLRDQAEGAYERSMEKRIASDEADRASDAGRATLRRLANLTRYEDLGDVPTHKALPDEPQWHGRRLVHIRGTDIPNDEWRILMDHEEAEGDKVPLHLVGDCPRCQGRVVLEPAFATLEELGYAMRYGKPSRHDCPAERAGGLGTRGEDDG